MSQASDPHAELCLLSSMYLPTPLPASSLPRQGTVGVSLFWMVPREHLEIKRKPVLALVSSYNLEPRWRGTVCPHMPQDVSPLPGELPPVPKVVLLPGKWEGSQLHMLLEKYALG